MTHGTIKHLLQEQNSELANWSVLHKLTNTTVSKEVGDPSWEVWWACTLGPMGTSISEESQWESICCSVHRWPYPWNPAVFPAHQESNLQHDEAMIETHSGCQIKFCRSNRGNEFWSKQFKDHQDSKGMLCEATVHDSPPQNGVSEYRMHTWMELMCTLLIASGLLRFLWEEAMRHITWL